MDQRIDWPSRTASWVNQNGEALMIGLGVAVGLVVVMLILRSIGERVRAADPDCTTWRSVIGHVLAKTSVIFMVIAALDTVASYVEPPRLIARTLDIAFIIAFALQGAVWARELILGLIGRRVAEDEGRGTLGNAMGVIRVLVSVALFAVAIILILDNLGVNVTALIAGLGIGGIAIGLAAQGIFSDLFAALAILFDKPFKKGDTIRYDQSTGTVERIGLKTTRLRSLTGEQLVMGNTKLLEREIHNLAAAKARRMTVYFAVDGRAAAQTLDAVAAAADEAVASQKGCKLVRCVLVGVGGGGLAHELVYDDSALDNDRIARNRAAILRALIERMEAQQLQLVQASGISPPLAPF
ncbi:mechanosensitive ion channel family protein [Sphingomonas hankyongi]|uniref:Mechanosensitive ion channel family protein n=1 Tax=Sphingomonas hankyongi TaxID=2908209 RepID=A0ABT0RYZ5_9SPHN|nr:mechanosensitive ion channel domain-containing protein [Sphingomonas hankyongi]MCL6728601.1 mechanosensitive ion channel family protein [Sphingomonas hankyongi]